MTAGLFVIQTVSAIAVGVLFITLPRRLFWCAAFLAYCGMMGLIQFTCGLVGVLMVEGHRLNARAAKGDKL